jgi:hypothetical protein
MGYRSHRAREHRGEMIAAPVHGERRDGHQPAGATARARWSRPLHTEDRPRALAHPRGEHPRLDPGRHCGQEIRDLHGRDAVVRLRHRPWFDVPVCVALRPTRFRGPDGVGHPTTPPRGAWDEPRSPHTTAYEPWAWRLLSHAPGTDAARTLARGRGPMGRARQRPVP